MSVTGVIFDCDGTLLDSMDAWLCAQAELARRAGVALTDDDEQTLITMTIPETGGFFHDRFGLGEDAVAVVGMIDEIMLEHYSGEYVVARPGALGFVRGLHEAGVVCSVASSTPQKLLRAGLDNTGFSPYLVAVVSVDDVGVSKRDPDVYHHARELMGTPLESTWVFEDSVYALRTLRAAGYHTVGVYDQDVSGTVEQLSVADEVILGFTDLDAAEFLGTH